jgi:hypothetical protein
MMARNTLHGSGHAGFPHPALALGDDAHAAQGIGMTDSRHRQRASDETPHAIPKNAAVLAPPRHRAMPRPAYSESKKRQRRSANGHSVVAKVSTHNRPQPLALLGDGSMDASLKFGFYLVQLRPQSFVVRLPQHLEPSIAPLLHANLRKAEKVERLRFPFSTPLPVVDRIRTELQKSSSLGMQLQVELLHSLCKFRPELVGLRLALESNHDIVRETHHEEVSVRPLLTPRLDPHVEHVMKADVGQQWRGTATLRRPFLHPYPFPILQHASIQPFLDEPHDAPVCRVRWWRGSGLRMMPTFPPPPLSFHAAGFPQYGWKVGRSGSAFPHVAQVKPAPGMPCAIRRFASTLRALRNPTLHPALCRNSESGSTLPCEELSPLPQRPSLRSGFSCPSPSTLNRPHPPHSLAHPAFPAWRVDVVQKSRESQLLILTCCLTYPLQRTERVSPARCPGRVLLGQAPFGQTSSLHPLRCRLLGVFRGLLRYSRSVRLTSSVRHRRTSLDFPMRPKATSALGPPGISRFPREVLPYVHGVCDRAGLRCTSRYRCTGWGLPLSPRASASRSEILTRLNTRPARSLVNASSPPSRAAPHDSGPMWVATSHSYDSFIHYTSPV